MSESILDNIVADVRKRLQWTPQAPGLERAAIRLIEQRKPPRRSLKRALAGPDIEIIAECKKASPSAGVIRENFDPVRLAQAYAAGHAAAISVVTERDSFAGDPGWLIEVRKAVDLPVLRKDFIIERRQLFETALLGADAVLLITRILSQQRLKDLLSTAEMLQLEVLLEIFADEDPGPAVDSGATIIGVNARDLTTFEIRLDRVEAAAAKIPDDRIRVAESGITGPDDIDRLRGAGYHAFLVGEHLVRSSDPEREVRRLNGRLSRPGA
ncbi:MAG: indole-3-glycerol phosphate synthase TrpC [Thermoanaerobaculales bacterium]|nr:indole-3-glycerol phosphate synthase TrpC [Thermoanaerobaculales bacterium]